MPSQEKTTSTIRTSETTHPSACSLPLPSRSSPSPHNQHPRVLTSRLLNSTTSPPSSLTMRDGLSAILTTPCDPMKPDVDDGFDSIGIYRKAHLVRMYSIDRATGDVVDFMRGCRSSSVSMTSNGSSLKLDRNHNPSRPPRSRQLVAKAWAVSTDGNQLPVWVH